MRIQRHLYTFSLHTLNFNFKKLVINLVLKKRNEKKQKFNRLLKVVVENYRTKDIVRASYQCNKIDLALNKLYVKLFRTFCSDSP